MNRLLLRLICALTNIVFAAQSPAREAVLHNFACPPKGANPYAGMLRDHAGNFYGTAAGGGKANKGVVFKLNTAGHVTVLYSFSGGADGANPVAGVIRDSADNLYGTTSAGGAAGAGVVYKLDSAGQETVLYTFTGGADGGLPNDVIRDAAGNLYGTTYQGGTAGVGVVYKLSPGGGETVLYNFTGLADGGYPYAGVIRDPAGNLYGTASVGGTANAGVVYKLSPSGEETVLYSFQGGSDGIDPEAGLIRDSAGNLYGTTYGGGAASSGIVYRLDAAGLETVLYSFSGADGAYPRAGVILDSSGNLYGTTSEGGTTNSGVVYRLTGAGKERVLHSFNSGADGFYPYSGVTLDSAGNLYGTVYGGGAANLGALYTVNTAGQESTIYSFPSPPDGNTPVSGVTRDAAGNLYGTTFYGGPANAGVVYKLDSTGNESMLYSFTGGADGANPNAGITLDAAGNLYGTTYNGGAANAGVVFKLDPAGQEIVLYTFSGGTDGYHPYAGVTLDSAGNLYGTTVSGGARNSGVVYKLDTAGRETVQYSFKGGTDGYLPYGGVILDSAGNLYGTTYYGAAGNGTVYKLDAAGNETLLYTFPQTRNGSNPHGGVIRDSAGNLYGTTYRGGTAGAGVVFKLNRAGRETVLYNFTGGADGARPYDGVISDTAGNLYGTTSAGGADNAGVVYKLDTTRAESVLYTFTGGAGGGGPEAGVILDSAGNLYGTASGGGTKSAGVLFEIEP